ncbi:Phosphatidylinositol 4-phosphate 5-kinase 1 [Cardamine amara subsp. amara]|uniref:Phosphatidylinositol 4-phosphate 5-kinase 1 n=1 Tax=Cardamine amara subsp. amara TaxID=228776 RepID=A0ABD1B743_CARAN
MSQTKLTRTQSSLLRSSPTIRSSIQSLSSITECDHFNESSHHREQDLETGEKEEKQRRKKPVKSFGSSNRIKPGLAFTLVSLSFLSLTSFLLFIVFSQTNEIFTSENLLLGLIFVAVALFFASRNMAVINQTVIAIKQIREETSKKLGFRIKHKPKPVQWYIGDSNQESVQEEEEKRLVVKEGVQFFSNGDIYEGEFNRGRCNGSGVYYYFVNGRYEGDWINGRYDGYGIECWSKGSKYKGQYKQGLRHGFGVYWFYTGDSYSGEWFNGQSHGFGVQTCADGSSYVGEFKFGVKHGLGSYHFRNGDKYAGEYFGDKIHGFGVYHFANGHYYEGAWHEGRKQGYGTYGFRNGDTKSGEWDDGNLINRLSPETNPVHRAVQSAREMSKKGVNQRRVDEQVIRAVAAANKAATAARVAAVKAVQNQMDALVSLKL